MYSAEELKESITPEDVFSLLEYYNADPEFFDDYIVASTICHNGDSRKLYYYFNSGLFNCYTQCGTFDIIELVQKINDISFNDAITFLVSFFSLFAKINDDENLNASEDYAYLKRWEELNDIEGNISSERLMPEPIDLSIIEHYPQPIIKNWVEEGIAPEVCEFAGIRFDPLQSCVIIPHFNDLGLCVGIRQRTLLKEEEVWGKYRPWRHGKKVYNHPLSTTLYGLNWSKDRIAQLKTAVIMEAEKSVLTSMSIFGTKGNICLGICGSSFSKYHFNLLWDLGVEELVFALDKDFKELESPEYYNTLKKAKKICEKFSGYFNVSCMFDIDNLYLGYKQSPIEQGKDVFMKLFEERHYANSWM